MRMLRGGKTSRIQSARGASDLLTEAQIRRIVRIILKEEMGAGVTQSKTSGVWCTFAMADNRYAKEMKSDSNPGKWFTWHIIKTADLVSSIVQKAAHSDPELKKMAPDAGGEVFFMPGGGRNPSMSDMYDVKKMENRNIRGGAGKLYEEAFEEMLDGRNQLLSFFVPLPVDVVVALEETGDLKRAYKGTILEGWGMTINLRK